MYDVIIIGAGPAGLSASLYAGRADLKTLLLEKGMAGGQIGLTSEVENYPGGASLPGKPESGFDLVTRMTSQCEGFGVTRLSGEVTEAELKGSIKRITVDNKTYESRAVIIATGAHAKKLGCPGEEKFAGRGVSYCATCDGAFFRNKHVFVIGGGDTALDEAIFLTRFAAKVTIVHRRDALRANATVAKRAAQNPKIEFAYNSVLTEIAGEDFINRLTLKDTITGETRDVTAPDGSNFGVFIFVGFTPNSELFPEVEKDRGYIITDEDMKTNLPLVYAAGDVRRKSLRQVITAASDGAVAATICERELAALA